MDNIPRKTLLTYQTVQAEIQHGQRRWRAPTAVQGAPSGESAKNDKLGPRASTQETATSRVCASDSGPK